MAEDPKRKRGFFGRLLRFAFLAAAIGAVVSAVRRRDGLDLVHRILAEGSGHLTRQGALLCELGRGRNPLERAYPRTPFVWLDTELSQGEVFWLEREGFPTMVTKGDR